MWQGISHVAPGQPPEGYRGDVDRLRTSAAPCTVCHCPSGRPLKVLRGAFLRIRAPAGKPERSGRKRTLEGAQSPWKDRTWSCWQRWHHVTDSQVEQRLEGGCSAGRPTEGCDWQRSCSEVSPARTHQPRDSGASASGKRVRSLDRPVLFLLRQKMGACALRGFGRVTQGICRSGIPEPHGFSSRVVGFGWRRGDGVGRSLRR